jgi:hypothetical protein
MFCDAVPFWRFQKSAAAMRKVELTQRSKTKKRGSEMPLKEPIVCNSVKQTIPRLNKAVTDKEESTSRFIYRSLNHP